MARCLASGRLDRICAELEISPGVGRRFVRDYLSLLDERLQRIDHAIDGAIEGSSGDDGAATGSATGDGDATIPLLGLESSSSMLGAFPVALAARRLRIELQTGRVARVESYRRELQLAVAQVRDQFGEI